mgnify:FL=1
MKKRLLSALCAVMLLICAVPMASAQTGDAARRADALTVLHLLSEDPGRDLTAPATRAQAAVLLVRLAGGEKKPDTDGWFAGFRDVPDWARTAANYANRRGWISGVSNVQFDPNGHLNADAWCAMLLRMLGYSDKTGDFEISDAAAFAWRIGLTGRQLIGILSVGDLAESIYDALDFCYKGTETTVLSRLMDLGVCTASAANALGLLNKDYTARQLADRYLSAAFQLSLYETEEQVHDEVSSADASGFFISADGLAVTNYHSIEDSIKILKGLAPNYEAYHGVKISDGILRQAVLLSERYITDRFLPDKAIDLIDEACSDLNLKDPDISRRMQLQREIDDFEKERAMLEEQGAQEGAEPDYEQIATLKSKILQRQTELNTLLLKGDPQLTMENIAHVIELWTKIPASKIREEEFQRLSQLEERLKSHIVGQDEAIAAVSAAVRRNRVGISPKHKPVSFIFVGSTGVGKTELVKQLAVDLFNTPDALIRLDMSEFMEKHSVSRIVGSPPGYVGYDEAGQLTEKIRRKPYAVILFDEIEKAHPDVLNVLLQILDDGEITDSHGRRVNFENTIIVMTSNAGSGNQDGGTVGFDRSQTQQDADKAMKALQQFLRPEFINRVDAVITFNRLSKENFKEIAKIMLGELVTSLGDKGIAFTYDDSLVEFLVEKSFSRTYGARNLRRTIQKELEDPMATKIIDSYEHPVSRIHAAAENEAIRLDAL